MSKRLVILAAAGAGWLTLAGAARAQDPEALDPVGLADPPPASALATNEGVVRRPDGTVVYANDPEVDRLYWLDNDTQWRHNRTCALFKKFPGRYCGPADGKPCPRCEARSDAPSPVVPPARTNNGIRRFDQDPAPPRNGPWVPQNRDPRR